MDKIMRILCLLLLCLIMSVLDHRNGALAIPLPVVPALELSALSAVSKDVVAVEKDDLQENASYGYGYYSQPFYRHNIGGYYGSPYYGGLGGWAGGLNSVYGLGKYWKTYKVLIY